MLYYRPVAVSLGYDSYPVNEGSMYNRGIEMQLNATVFKSKDINVDINANMTTLKNKITSYPTVMKGSMLIREEGGSIYESYLRSYAGVWHGDASEYAFDSQFDQSTLTLGDALYFVDPDNGDYTVTNVYSSAKQAHQGSTAPKAYGGFGLTAAVYGFDLSVQFAYQLGGKLYDHKYQGLMSSDGGTGHNWSVDIANAWSPENPTSNVPRLDTGVNDSQNTSDGHIMNDSQNNSDNDVINNSQEKPDTLNTEPESANDLKNSRVVDFNIFNRKKEKHKLKKVSDEDSFVDDEITGV
jgi:hypothetical protein